MSQSTYVRGSGLSGTSYRTADNDAKAAIVSSHKGSSRPSYVLAGTVWVDDSANPVWTICMYDGADDISLGTLNVSTNVFTPASNTASVAEVLTGTDTAKSSTPDAVAALWEQGTDIASASSLAIPSSGGGYFFVTGTTTITAISQSEALKTGREVTLKFNGALTLTHNATSLILPGGANITTAAGDVAMFRCEDAGSNYWRCTSYMKATGLPVVGSTLGAIAVLEDQKSSGTAGGTFTSGAWRTRDLNTEVTDTDSIVSLSSNQFTLAAGTYEIYAFCEGYTCGIHQARIYNISDSAAVLLGVNTRSEAGGGNVAHVNGRFTIAGSKVFELQHQCNNTEATDGFGAAGSFGTEVYAQVIIRKVG